jgi:hydroxymethylglutaryl-CoA reductase
MSLHARQIALAAGATGDAVDRIAAQLIHEGRIRLERAKELVTEAAHPNATTRR